MTEGKWNLPVFVYGTLLHGFENHRLYVAPYPHHAIPARANGRLFHLPEWGYPAVVANGSEEEGWVYGELLYFPDSIYGEVLAGLDELETYFTPGDERNEYERETVTVTRLDTGELIRAYMYVMKGERERYARDRGIFVPDGDWRGFMTQRQ
jgi:gamma-glutamylcyclotransferase (GGCT)/AIG2-like uncharacterized protein YtfP